MTPASGSRDPKPGIFPSWRYPLALLAAAALAYGITWWIVR